VVISVIEKENMIPEKGRLSKRKVSSGRFSAYRGLIVFRQLGNQAGPLKIMRGEISAKSRVHAENPPEAGTFT
jgi:hypothetical protein